MEEIGSQVRSKSWMYTVNNYNEEQYNQIIGLECNYHVCGKEVGESGTPHLQGCITFKTIKSFKQVKKVIDGHLTKPVALVKAREYCKKDGDFVEIDNRQKPGRRNDIHNFVDGLKEGKSMREMALESPEVYVKYHKGLQALMEKMQAGEEGPREPSDKPEVHWYYGDTGTGKTREVFRREAFEDVWISGDTLQFFNGYHNQPAVVFDDFRGGMVKFRLLLRLLDRYPMPVSIKGWYANWNPKRIYITSNKRPEEAYFKSDEDLQQLRRRIDVIVRFSGTGKHVEKGLWCPHPI